MNASMTLGTTPWGESCAQLGTHDFEIRAQAECNAYKAQLARHYHEAHGHKLPEGVTLSIETKAHDFGNYFEVHVNFDDESEQAVKAAYWLEANSPEEWDEQARVSLGIPEPVYP